ncbi:hypothetical protein UL82_07915 [Corynebacterium kutscheri]|uniref:Trehalose corynomycolyl transferase n=1 Tax=Corynebacterium kutscheri TaxID=35755 RepID=A0A0F6TDM4_9CORY|nr:hypothetical protein [Corynebacterium kutscheri]AKE41744.1 hypothetical protein UL82_07915 [Corynebacterium kutscheri]VEH09019.1 trehalose corynomycolyl transferase [Corynebacterium kutscheri]VEH10070.1 trehalose corynomycolyl transferase [Corynebacterium kutscheri]
MATSQEDPQDFSAITDQQTPDATIAAPGREGLEPAEPGFNDNTLNNQAGAAWHPTDCASLVWAAYMYGGDKPVDIGHNKYLLAAVGYRSSVFPIDIANSTATREFE